MEAVAKWKNCKGSPKKIRLVTDMIKGKGVEEALNNLRFSKKRASQQVEKLLMSAISNWQDQNEDVRLEDANLYVKRAFVNQGQSLKRWRPAAMGMVNMYKKKMSHITLVVDSKNDVEQQKKSKKKQKQD